MSVEFETRNGDQLPVVSSLGADTPILVVQDGQLARTSVLALLETVPELAALAYARFKGDPGGNVMSIGLWIDLSSFDVPVGTDMVQTDGYSVRGTGGARYVLDSSQVDATPTAYRRKSQNGRWFRLSRDQPFTLAMFGAIPGGEAGMDCSAPMTSAFAYHAFPLRIEPSATAYRFLTGNAGPGGSIAVPTGAMVDARGARLLLDSTGLPDDFRYLLHLDDCGDAHWLGGRITRVADIAGLFLGGGDNAGNEGRIRVEGVIDSSRGMMFYATPITNGTAAAIASIDVENCTFTIPNHGLVDGELISLYRADGNNALYAGLETHRDYYVDYGDENTFRVAETEALALSSEWIAFRDVAGSFAPDRIRKGLVPSGKLEIIDCRCEDAGAGPHVFGMWKHVTISNLSGYTQSVQLFQFEKPGGGVWTAWGHPFVAQVDDVRVESSALGGAEFTHCHEIYASRIKIRNANRKSDGTLWGVKPENPSEVTAYAALSVGARTRVMVLDDIDCEGSPHLSVDGPRSAWSEATDTPGLKILQPSGQIFLRGIRGSGNAGGDILFDQVSGDGYTNFIRRSDRITIRDTRLLSTTPIIVTTPHAMPPIDADATVDGAGRYYGAVKPRFMLQSWNIIGPDAAKVSWFSLSGDLTVDTADKLYGWGSLKYRGNDDYNHVEIQLGDQLGNGEYVHVYAAVKFNSAHYSSPPNFAAAWGDDADTLYPFLGVTIGEFRTDEWIIIRTIMPISATTTALRIYPHAGQATPSVSAPDWYCKINGLWVWASPNWLTLPGVDLDQRVASNGVPTIGTHARGSSVYASDPVAAGVEGWKNIDAGTSGTWKSFGTIGA